MSVVRVIVILFRVFLLRRAALAAEILALRHQLGVLQRSVKRPRLRQRDRILWVWCDGPAILALREMDRNPLLCKLLCRVSVTRQAEWLPQPRRQYRLSSCQAPSLLP